MFDRIIADALRSADIPGDQFDAAIKGAGYKTRMDWFLRGSPKSLQEAYNLRVEAEAVVASRDILNIDSDRSAVSS